ncbi:MAG TPA: NAD(P)H-dependent oxidoreductase subunit E, partial [Ilumatobacteraceae bacterium]|nr:NAD(P)H-dependent oxidoreductase subunit E [Ilumatobacteraceae bacterium]
MSRLTEANVIVAKEIIGRYPRPRSAAIPLLHLAQQQNGYITNDAIAHIADLVGATSAQILGTATFYEMFKFEPVGKYLLNI